MSGGIAEPAERHDLGHRSYVTVLFADLCGYTTLSEAIDPEELYAIRNQLDELANAVIQKHSGHVTQVYGDGQLCLFGFPEPREDDVRRSLEAALELHSAVRSHSWPRLPSGFEVRLHTGVHTGLVFVRSGTALHGRYVLSGDAVNTAARLCGIAERDEIVVTATTIGGSEQFFETKPMPPVWLKGKSAPQAVLRVTGRSNVRTRFEARSRRGLTTFVNRHVELGRLLQRLQGTGPGRGGLFVVSGAAGIGKTRLFEELSARAHDSGMLLLRGTCESYGDLAPLTPFTQTLRQVFGDAPGDAEGETEAWLERQCTLLGAAVAERLSTLLVLLALRPARGAELTSANTIGALEALIDALVSRQPLALILDDWQWADGASRTVLGQLRPLAQARGVCIVLGMRASEPVDLTLQPDEWVPLHPLTDNDSARFIAALHPNAISLDVRDVVLERAGGNPLFLEELCHVLPQLSPDTRRPFERLQVPTTVQGVIQARVASLAPADRQLLRLASVIGIEFSASTLAELCGATVPEIHTRLKALMTEDLVYCADGLATYHFKHGLTREVVYDSVLIAERKQLHRRVAELFERTAAASGDSMQVAEALAYHYRGSGDLEHAAQYAELAGDRAMTVSALDRACHHYLAAMAALDEMPVSIPVRRRWLAICEKWGLPFIFSPVGADAHLPLIHTAAAYATELGDLHANTMCSYWLGWAHYGLGNYAESIEHYSAAVRAAELAGNVRVVVQLQAGLGQSQAAAGDYQNALPNLNSATASKRARAGTQAPRRGSVPQGYAYALAATALVHADRGEFALADQLFDEALGPLQGRKPAHAIEGSVLALKSIALLWRGHWHEARETALRAQQNGQLVNSAFNIVTCSLYGTYAAWELTRLDEHLQRMQVTIDWVETQHLELFAGCDYGWFAHMLQCVGEHERARAYVERALRRAASGDPMGEASAYRVLARLGPAEGDLADASHVEICLERATRAGEKRQSRHEAVKTLLLRAELGYEHGDVVNARQWAEAARAEARELDMRWHVQQADHLLALVLRLESLESPG